MSSELVVHCKRAKYDVYVGRPSEWGNPYSHLENTLAEFKVATREEAIEAFRTWFLSRPAMVQRAKQQLKGKILGCWCAPKSCHGEVLVEIANQNSLDTVGSCYRCKMVWLVSDDGIHISTKYGMQTSHSADQCARELAMAK